MKIKSRIIVHVPKFLFSKLVKNIQEGNKDIFTYQKLVSVHVILVLRKIDKIVHIQDYSTDTPKSGKE